MKRSKNHPTAQNSAKNLSLTLKCFNSTLISVVVYSEARQIALLLVGKGVRFLTCSESFPKTFFYALTSDFLYANSVNVGKYKSPFLSFIHENSSPELFNIYSNDNYEKSILFWIMFPSCLSTGAILPLALGAGSCTSSEPFSFS